VQQNRGFARRWQHARWPGPPCQRPQGRILAGPLEQSRPCPARPQHPDNRADHHSHQPRDASIGDTPKPVLDRPARPL